MHFLSRYAFLILLLVTCFGCTSQPEPDQPNIIVILADDMGYSDIGAYGGEVQSPNLDHLAEQGLRFTQFYNAARCCPTRASLLTGLYPHQAGMGAMVSSVDSSPEPGPYQGYLDPHVATMAEALKTVGYKTYMSGKWHVGEKPEYWPRKRGFDRYFGLISGASSYYEIIRDQPRIRQMALDDDPWDPPAEGFYMTDAVSDYAVQYLQDHNADQADDPFFLYVAYTAPHWPLHAPAEDIARYEGVYDIGWDSLRVQRYNRMLEMGLIEERHALSERNPAVPAWDEAENKASWIRRMMVYAAMIDRMDQGVGRIRETLAQIGEEDNTLILFLSDNGACAENIDGRNLNDGSIPVGEQGSYVAYEEPWANASNTPYRFYKQWTHEGGILTPLIAYWPAGITRPGSIIKDEVGHVIDIMATGLELAGVTEGPEIEGKSLVPTLKGQQREGHEALYWEHIGNRGLRKGKWKLVFEVSRSDTWALFDLEVDPTEIHDISGNNPELFESLKAEWQTWADRVGVTR